MHKESDKIKREKNSCPSLRFRYSVDIHGTHFSCAHFQVDNTLAFPSKLLLSNRTPQKRIRPVYMYACMFMIL